MPPKGSCSPKLPAMLQDMQVTIPTTGLLPREWGGIQPWSCGSHRSADSPTHPLHPASGSWGTSWAPSLLASHTETNLQDDCRCDSLTSLPGLPGKTNREMFNKPHSTDQIWETHENMEQWALLRMQIQFKTLYMKCLSLKRILRGVPQLLNSPMPSAQYNTALRHCTSQKPPGWKASPGHAWCY